MLSVLTLICFMLKLCNFVQPKEGKSRIHCKKVVHPNSRKASKLARQAHRDEKLQRCSYRYVHTCTYNLFKFRIVVKSTFCGVMCMLLAVFIYWYMLQLVSDQLTLHTPYMHVILFLHFESPLTLIKIFFYSHCGYLGQPVLFSIFGNRLFCN